ncbi:hypothetical protein [Chthoniobacter flavus]|uniref:hypothetical protein n=1 Tax=Chthoniobacter flavus TaxID=191863 RepID=UPI0012F8AFDE|nr:hypothetical protein [Chthoniobacter flavus]
MPISKLQVGLPVPHVLSLKPGDAVAIPLVNGKWAFGRVFRAATLGIFQCLSTFLVPPDKLLGTPIAFHVGFYCMPKQKPDFDWVYLGCVPFESDEEAWPPPQYSEDVASPGHFHLHYKGKISPAGDQQIRGLERHVMSSPGSIRKRVSETSTSWPNI